MVEVAKGKYERTYVCPSMKTTDDHKEVLAHALFWAVLYCLVLHQTKVAEVVPVN